MVVLWWTGCMKVWRVLFRVVEGLTFCCIRVLRLLRLLPGCSR